jgi:N utilization substance protein B
MISRRLLRIKVLQILYAYFNGNNEGITHYEKDLLKSINKSYDLYHLFFLLLIDIKAYAKSRIELAKSRKMATQADLNPNTRFIKNKVIEQLANTPQLIQYVDENKLSWKNYPELIKRVYNDMIVSDSYARYMELCEDSYSKDKEFVMTFFQEYLVDNDLLYQILEEHSIYWNDDIEFVLGMNIKTIERVKPQKPAVTLMNLFKNEDDRDFVIQLYRKVILNHEDNNKLIQSHIKNWDVERVAQMDLLIMEMALVEILNFESVPVKVSFNEYIDLARFYSTDRSNAFVNGILDKIIIDLKKQGKVNKTGRGLME